VVTDRGNQTEITKDESHHFHVVVPNINEAVKDNFKDNAAYVKDQLSLPFGADNREASHPGDNGSEHPPL
jgi:hypothetical protein